MVAVASVFISIILLMFFAYRGLSVLILAPVLSLFAVFTSGCDFLLAHYTQIFMVKLGDFVTVYFPIFLLSAIFGKTMEACGAARSIANYISDKIGADQAILAVILSCSVLTYGGVSLFVVAFAVYPIAVELFKKSNAPKRLIPGTIAVGAFTYTMNALPGTPAIQNVIPSQYFGTNTFAAPGISIIASTFLFVFGWGWMQYQLRLARERGEGYGEIANKSVVVRDSELPDFRVAIAPVLLVILVNFVCVTYIFPNIDTSYLSQEKFGTTEIKTLAGNWAIIVSLFCAIVLALLTNLKRLNLAKCINNGAVESLSPIFNTASVVGYGAVINCLPGFIIIREWILSCSPNNPTISSAFVTSLLSGITGSASGGMSIALETFGARYLDMAHSIGMSPEILHRVVSLASGCLDTLPHNGAVITLLAICKLSHKESYKDIFIAALIGPLLVTVLVVIINSLFGTF